MTHRKKQALVRGYRIIELLVVGLFILLLANCNKHGSHYIQPTVEPSLVYLSRFMLNGSDVPSHWYDSGEFFRQAIPGADALSRGFEGTDDPDKGAVFLKQELRIYSDSQSATTDYLSEEEIYNKHPEYWHDLSTPSYEFKAEKFRFVCQNIEGRNFIPLLHCDALQLYGRAFSLVYVDINNSDITLGEVEGVLKRVDEKLASFSEKK